jgi:hypothetical protein
VEANRKRNIKSGKEYDHLFPEAAGNNATIRKNANVYHTVAFIPKVVNETLYQTKALANQLNRNNIYETCKNIWHFVYQHINYKKDAPGYEQIRSPARAWHDRFTGVDCDCYSVFISSILSNLGIPHILRITKYHRDYFQHIYPVVPFQNGFITIDCVTDQFNYEVPFSEKKDYPMDLQYLNGFENPNTMYESGDGMAELGRILQKRMGQTSKKSAPAKKGFKPSLLKKSLPGLLKKKKLALPAQDDPAANPVTLENQNPLPDGNTKPKKKKFLGKMLNVVNKVNPATVLLRNGILASMKLNVRNVAARLRWSYLSPQQASAKSIDPVKFQKLLNARMKLEKIFFGAGGNPKNLKKAILSGKGNKDKAVNGFDGFGMLVLEGVQYMNEYTSMPELLGTEIYEDENVNGMEGFGELGEPITLSSIAAAAGVIAGIVAMLKDVGNIFQKKTKDAEDFDETKNEEADKNAPVPPPTATPSILPPALPTVTIKENVDVTENTVKTIAPPADEPSNAVVIKSTPETIPAEIKNEAAPATTASNNVANNDNADNTGDNPGFWEKNKKWLKPVAIGVGGLTIIGIGYSLMKGGKTQNKSSPPAKGLSGTPRSKKRKNQQRKKTKHHKKKAIALL